MDMLAFVKCTYRRYSVGLHVCGKRVKVKVIVTTDGQSASLSWCQSPIWGQRPNFYFCQTVSGLLMRAPSLARGRVCRLQLLLVLASAVILGSGFHGSHDHILFSQIGDFPNLEGQVPVFIFSRKRVTQLYPQASGSLFVASYDLQGYGGNIRPRLHTGGLFMYIYTMILLGKQNYSIIARVSVA
jgi:hypothetical protein